MFLIGYITQLHGTANTKLCFLRDLKTSHRGDVDAAAAAAAAAAAVRASGVPLLRGACFTLANLLPLVTALVGSCPNPRVRPSGTRLIVNFNSAA